ncbi:Fe-S-cluster-containing dehydrogenase component [Desulfocicer vacuolatum DSM 3385]|uniref:Fe-S-cluster-containing dehydrogenase component n=1 Tax=Desulfocicer vacuolatum DSM 3385 TaxID=1121400 RepID=A0A1W2EIG5_9BACT|nr:4Fe-4S dicluster domain-containing protein [Desulfocicer vacuolatum]SMD09493.1 Fe-S-cluster-containing dehydrogenase component [Desulfocicer vacuolatum DSM 3385]
MRFITMDIKKCVVCRNCEYACSFQHTGDFNRADSNIRVAYHDDIKICLPQTCMHCEDAWCMEICPAAAITKNEETGAVEIDSGRCAGCKMCILACPFGNIHFDKSNLISRKCNLCKGEPQCVAACISGALQYVTAGDSCRNNREIFQRFMATLHTPL